MRDVSIQRAAPQRRGQDLEAGGGVGQRHAQQVAEAAGAGEGWVQGFGAVGGAQHKHAAAVCRG
jgi:hypothetical protein